MNYISIILVVFIFVIVGVFLIRSKLVSLMNAGLKFFFFALAAVALVAILIPVVFDKIADFSLKQAGVYEKITNIDEDFSGIETATETTQGIWNDISSLWGGSDDSKDSDSEGDAEGGIFERNVYPGLVSFVSVMIRIFTLIFSIGGLIAMIYLSYATVGASDLDSLKSKVAELEDKVAILEGGN
ncbi:hypothetical protein JW887_02170 [Candidatus Dojkabacteria bacterium]|nr:hypothetical protein [Candidatus Dojkabacteria bacterium]